MEGYERLEKRDPTYWDRKYAEGRRKRLEKVKEDMWNQEHNYHPVKDANGSVYDQ